MLICKFSYLPLPLSTARSRPRTCFSALTFQFSSMLMVPNPMPRFYPRDDLLLHRGRLCITSRALSTSPPTSKTKTNRARIARHLRLSYCHSPMHLLTCLPAYPLTCLTHPLPPPFSIALPILSIQPSTSHNPLTLFSLFRYSQ